MDKLIIHSDFDSWILDNDIALLLLQSPLSLDVNNVPICLSKVTDVQRWNGCLVTGWGTHGSELPPIRVGWYLADVWNKNQTLGNPAGPGESYWSDLRTSHSLFRGHEESCL